MRANERSGRDVVVLGAGYAGLRCALRLAWRDPRATITVVDAAAAALRDEAFTSIRGNAASGHGSIPS